MDNQNNKFGIDVKYSIVDAPSKWSLSLAFFDHDGDKRRYAFFKIKDPLKETVDVRVLINQLQWEDGSGESWNFEGYARIEGKSFNVRGWFRTTDRKGYLFLVKEHVS